MVILLASLATGAALRLVLAFTDQGLFWPDEIYQSLEPAHRAAFGYGLLAWEFIDGARNWTFPALIAAVVKLASFVRQDSPRAYLAVVRVMFCAGGVATAIGIFRLARISGAHRFAAACGSAFFALMGLAIYLAPRAMSETASALAVTAGLAFALSHEASRRTLWAGASLMGISTLIRLQCALFALGLLAVLLGRRSYRAAVEVLCVLAAWALLFGLIDKLTWGSWFHSAIAYLRFNWVERGAQQFGTAPGAFYTARLLSSLGALWLAIAALALIAAARASGLWIIALLFFIPHWLSPHKELRFIVPLIPILCVLAAVGLQAVIDRNQSWLSVSASALALACAVYSAATFKQLTFGKLGLYEKSPGRRSAFGAGGPENRLLLAAHDAPDLCGLKVMSADLDDTGGFAYLHRRVPLYGRNGPEAGSRKFNYVIAQRGAVTGRVIVVDSGLVLARTAEGPCEPDPSYNWHLN